MGIGALLSSVKILNYVSKLCKRISSFLNKCLFLKNVFEKTATHIDMLVKYLKNAKIMADLEKAGRLAGKTYLIRAVASLSFKFVLIPTVKGVVMSVVMEKMVTEVLERSFENFRPVTHKSQGSGEDNY